MEGFNGIFKASRATAIGYRNTGTFNTIIYLSATPLGNLFNSICNFEETLFVAQTFLQFFVWSSNCQHRPI
jgi:hypothetical protein